MFTFSEMLALVKPESTFGAYVCHREACGAPQRPAILLISAIHKLRKVYSVLPGQSSDRPNYNPTKKISDTSFAFHKCSENALRSMNQTGKLIIERSTCKRSG